MKITTRTGSWIPAPLAEPVLGRRKPPSEYSRPRNDGDTRGTIWTARNARLSIGAGCCRRGVARSPLPPPVRCWRPGARARRRGRDSDQFLGGQLDCGGGSRFLQAVHRGDRCRVQTVAPVSYAKLKAQVQSGRSRMDVTEINQSEWLRAEREGLIEPIDWTVVQKDKLFPDAVFFANGISYCALGTNLCYRKDKFPNGGPQSSVDFWDVRKFPGARSLYNSAPRSLAFALLADGVPPDKLYPMDIDRGFRKLDQIKPHIKVWWTQGNQSQQLIRNGEIDAIAIWNARASELAAQGLPSSSCGTRAQPSITMWGVAERAPNRKLGGS